jgi:hypothetical protein
MHVLHVIHVMHMMNMTYLMHLMHMIHVVMHALPIGYLCGRRQVYPRCPVFAWSLINASGGVAGTREQCESS